MKRPIVEKQMKIFEFKKVFEIFYMQRQSFENEHFLIGKWMYRNDLMLVKCLDFEIEDVLSRKNLDECFKIVLNIQNYFKYLTR